MNELGKDNQAKLQPQLRFKGFTQPWEQRQLGKLFAESKENNGTTFDVEHLLSVGQMKWRPKANRDAGESLTGYRIVRVSDIVFEGHKASGFPYGRFVLNDFSDGIASPRFRSFRPLTPLNINFWKYFIHNDQVMRHILIRSTKRGTMMNELVPSDFLRQKVCVPQKDEQQVIGDFFKTLDSLISAAKRQYGLLKLQKRSYLQQMFPKYGKKQPQLRFLGFTDDWKPQQLGKLFVESRENNGTSFDADQLLSVGQMKWRPETNRDAGESLIGYRIIRVGDIVFEGHKASGFPYGRFVLNDFSDGIASPRFRSFRPLTPLNINFWKYFIHNDQVMRHILIRSTKRGTMMNELVPSDFLRQQVRIPQKSEQQVIGEFFQTLDSLISSADNRVEALQRLKQGYMQKMFV